MTDVARIAELQSAFEKKQAFIREGAAAIKIDGDNVSMGTGDYTAIKSAINDAQVIKGLIEVETYGDQIKSYGSMDLSPSVALSAAQAGLSAKSLGELFTASDEFKSLKASGRATMDTPFSIERGDVTDMGTFGQKDIHTGSAPVTSNLGFGRTQRDPMVLRPQRAPRVRDLFPVARTSANLIDFFRVTGFAENGGKGNAAPVKEYNPAVEEPATPASFGLKPKSNLKFTSAQAPVRTIAHWEAAHRNVIADEPQLQSVINNELLYGLSLEEDNQILNGDGTGENLLGILATPGIQSYLQNSVATDTKADAMRRAATLAILANYPANGYVLHPNDWEDIELLKATSGDGQYMLTTNFSVGLETRIWRQRVVETSAINEGTFLTGAFGTAAQLYDREQANVRITESHADFFVRNAIAILVESRIALAVKRPEAFVKGTFTAA